MDYQTVLPENWENVEKFWRMLLRNTGKKKGRNKIFPFGFWWRLNVIFTLLDESVRVRHF